MLVLIVPFTALHVAGSVDGEAARRSQNRQSVARPKNELRNGNGQRSVGRSTTAFPF
jgi:hypothetical protein